MNFLKPKEDKNHVKEIIIKSGGLIPTGILSMVIGNPTPLFVTMGTIGINTITERIFHSSGSRRINKWREIVNREISERKRNNQKYRQDGFLEMATKNRTKAAEAIESVLKKVWETTEEPKVDYQGYLTVNMLYDPDLDLDTFRYVLKYIDELSYRQLCIIKMYQSADSIEIDSLGNPNINTGLGSLLIDFLELCDKGFIDENDPLILKLYELYAGNSGNRIIDNAIRPPTYPGFTSRNGVFNIQTQILFKFANLNKIPDEDVNAILQTLRNHN